MTRLPTGTFAALGLAAGLVLAGSASATTSFAQFLPTSDSSNIALSGTALSANSGVLFSFLDPALAGLGTMAANLSFTANETGAAAFGSLALATFDGAFSLTYAGSAFSAGGYTVTPGEVLLSGTFTDAVFTGFGSSGSLLDSISGGGDVEFNDNNFLMFSSVGDRGMTIGLSAIDPVANVTGGMLRGFSAVAQGAFTANHSDVPPPGVPEPAAWSLMILGFGAMGATLRRRRAAIA
jgi:hypothetical protein